MRMGKTQKYMIDVIKQCLRDGNNRTIAFRNDSMAKASMRNLKRNLADLGIGYETINDFKLALTNDSSVVAVTPNIRRPGHTHLHHTCHTPKQES